MLAIIGLFGLALASLVIGPDTGTDADGRPDDDMDIIHGRTDCATDGTTQVISLGDFIDGTDAQSVGEAIIHGRTDCIATGTTDAAPGAPGDTVTIRGAADDDMIRGNDGDDWLFGLGGNDVIDGGRGDDVLLGGTGQDTLNGHVGDNVLIGGRGNDEINGGDGNDVLHGGAGDDTLMGYWGDDRLIGGAGADTLFGGDGNDALDGRERGAAEADFLNGGDGDDVIYAGALDMVHGGPGADILALIREEAAGGAATLQDFDAAEDRIVVYFDGAEPPVLDQAETEGGVMLLADGQPLALVQGVRAIDLAAIELIAA